MISQKRFFSLKRASTFPTFGGVSMAMVSIATAPAARHPIGSARVKEKNGEQRIMAAVLGARGRGEHFAICMCAAE